MAMNPDLTHYTALADLFRYPEKSLVPAVVSAQDILDRRYPAAGETLGLFTEHFQKTDLYELQELYLRSFDVQAITTLDIGYVLFGDDYKRGAMLVNLNREHQEVGNPCYNELADHLPNVLCLLPLLTDASFREELVCRIVAPAVGKIITEFQTDKIEAKERVYRKHHKTLLDTSVASRTLYRLPLQALFQVLEQDFKLTPEAAPETSSDFLKGIGTEISLEHEDA
jgi:nitrate reductase assembly molybdenum cofactor insertion protein NarJ